MRTGLGAIVVLGALTLAPTATGTPPSVTVRATPVSGSAPLRVTLVAAGDAATYHWNLGDGRAADGPRVRHAYAAGRHTVTVTATGATGETARARVEITATAVTLRAPRASAGWGERVVFAGSVKPARLGMPVTLIRDGAVVARTRLQSTRFRFVVRARTPGPYVARAAGRPSRGVLVGIRPGLDAHIAGSRTVGAPLVLHARLRPAGAGRIRVRIWRNGRLASTRAYGGTLRLPLDSSRAGSLRALVSTVPRHGYWGVRRVLRASTVLPSLSFGDRGPSVRVLEARLAELHYALERVDGLYDSGTYEAVLAFQKVEGLERTGGVTPELWRRLTRARTPAARTPSGDHVEVDKTRQVLFLVRDGAVALVVHVSTGATGNTPVGVWHVYRKVYGWSWVLWYPSYFLRGFAIHGYPDVPAYPASHGCVRVPMWLAVRLSAAIGYGDEIAIYP